MSYPIVRFLGSIKLAVPVLTVIVAILIGATFYEAQVGSATVQHLIYKSSWFGGLMFLLAVNLGVSAFSRYPWRGARKVGFAFTHIGLILIIAGSAAVIHLGTEGLILLRTDRGFEQQIRLEGEQLEVLNPKQELQKTNLFIGGNGSIYPAQFAGLSLLDYQEKTVKTVSFTEGGAVKNPAVKLTLHSDRMGQNLERWLAIAPVAYAQVPVGIAELAIVESHTPEALKQLLNLPQRSEANQFGTLILNHHEFKVKTNLSQTIQDQEVQVKLVNFWSDFGLDANNNPINRSESFNNPVVQLEVSATEGKERWFLFGNGDFAPVRSQLAGSPIENVDINYKITEQLPQDYFHVITTETGELYYTAHSSQGFKSGKLMIGEPINPGWADFKITVDQYLENGQLSRGTIPISDPNVEGSPAILVQTTTGTQQWLTWGEPTTIDENKNTEIFASFTPKFLTLPFQIALDDFIVERNEGSETVAMWTSQISLNADHNANTIHRRVWMNHPTWYQGWKIAQASWNPGDLQQSTLQIKREPIWVTALTWLGSIVVVLGIMIMFYGKSIMKKFKSKTLVKTQVSLEVESSEPEKEVISI